MKVFDILKESDEWENASFSNRKDEISFLEKKGKALQLQTQRLENRKQQWIANNVFHRGHPEIVKISELMKKITEQGWNVFQRIKELTVKGHTFVFTGFRDTGMERKIDTLGGRVTTSVSNKTDFVIAANPNETTGKVLKAKQLGVRILSKSQLANILRD